MGNPDPEGCPLTDNQRWKSIAGTVEMTKHEDGSVDLRDNPGGPTLEFTRTEWDAFIGGIKAGEFDLDRLQQPPPPGTAGQ